MRDMLAPAVGLEPTTKRLTALRFPARITGQGVTPGVTRSIIERDGSIVQPHTLTARAVLSDRPRVGGVTAFGGSISVQTLYRYYDFWGSLLYVGRTSAGKHRGSSHSRSSAWWRLVAFAEFCEVSSGIEFAERLAIWQEQPLYNIQDRVTTAQRQDMLGRLDAWELSGKATS